MRAGTLEKLDTLVPRILPQVIPCPRSMVLDALQTLSVDFCTQTGAWQSVIVEPVLTGEPRIPMECGRDAVVANVKAVYLDGNELPKAQYMVTPYDLVLRFTPQQNASATIDATIRPKRTAETLPAELLEEWGDILAYGALAKIKAMSGPNISWTDVSGASINLDLYNEGCARARLRVFRHRIGDGSLYLTAGE